MKRSRHGTNIVLTTLLVLSTVSGVQLQSSPTPEEIDFPPTEYDGVYMHMLLERTFLKVDVLTLEVWLAGEEADEIRALVAAGERSREVEDAIADAAIHSQDAYVRLLFIRDNISLDQFVDAAREDLQRVAKAGIVTEEHAEYVVANLPVWYSFLAERKIRKGDRMHYRIHGDTLHSQFVGVGGDIMLDQKDVGELTRLGELGSHFVRGSSYRDKLIKSLFVD